jgi:hypothetical protein
MSERACGAEEQARSDHTADAWGGGGYQIKGGGGGGMGDDGPDHGDMSIFELAVQLGFLVGVVWNALFALVVRLEGLVGLRRRFLRIHHGEEEKAGAIGGRLRLYIDQETKLSGWPVPTCQAGRFNSEDSYLSNRLSLADAPFRRPLTVATASRKMEGRVVAGPSVEQWQWACQAAPRSGRSRSCPDGRLHFGAETLI